MHISNIIGEKRSKAIKLVIADVKHLLSRKQDVLSSKSYTLFQVNNQDTFFGYYDISPFCPQNNDIVTYISINSKTNEADIYIDNLKSPTPHHIATTKVWNWQQGCRLRWLPYSNRTLLFNSLNSDSYISSIYDLETGQTINKKHPYYDIDKKAKYGITTDFSRLGVLRPGYGYTNYKYDVDSVKPMDSCVQIYDFKEEVLVDTISYSDVLKSLGHEDVILYEHKCYVNHLCFSPFDNKFLFFFVEIINGYHHANMLVYDIEKKSLVVLEKNMKVSHYMWENCCSIIATCYDNKHNCNYYRYSLSNGVTCSLFMEKLLCRDGHPGLLTDKLWISDTYPDTNTYYQHLFIIDPVHSKVENLLDVYSTPHFYGERRTDLHPRSNKLGTRISIDVNITGKRNMLVLSV